MRTISRQCVLVLLSMGLAGAALPAEAGLFRELDHYGYGTPVYADAPVRSHARPGQPRETRMLKPARLFHRVRLAGPRDPLVIPGPRIPGLLISRLRMVPESGPRFGWFTPDGSIYSEVLIAGARPNWVTWTRNVRNGFGYGQPYFPVEPLVELERPLFRRP